MWALGRIARALEELTRLHQVQEARLNRHDVERVERERVEREQTAVYLQQMEATTKAQQRIVEAQEGIRHDNQEHLVKCEKRYVARIAGEEIKDEVKH